MPIGMLVTLDAIFNRVIQNWKKGKTTWAVSYTHLDVYKRQATICAIAREQAHASFDTVCSGYYRQAYAALAYCAAYVTAQKFGVDTSAFHFDKVCQSCAQLPPEEKRSFIGDVKRATYFINRDMQRSFRDLEQAIQPDEFSVEAAKPVKAPKAKAEKEPER